MTAVVVDYRRTLVGSGWAISLVPLHKDLEIEGLGL